MKTLRLIKPWHLPIVRQKAIDERRLMLQETPEAIPCRAPQSQAPMPDTVRGEATAQEPHGSVTAPAAGVVFTNAGTGPRL